MTDMTDSAMAGFDSAMGGMDSAMGHGMDDGMGGMDYGMSGMESVLVLEGCRAGEGRCCLKFSLQYKNIL